MLELQDLYAGYQPGEWILKGVNLSLPQGGRLAVLGQNGSGKSTLSKAIMGIAPFVKGNILFEGERLNGLQPWQMADRGIAYFYQGGRVFPNLSVRENLELAVQRLPKNLREHKIGQIEPHFELLKKDDRVRLNAGYLSGGERHQLALAMCLVACPEIKLLIADEPSAGLSIQSNQAIFKLLLSDQIAQSLLIIEQNTKLLMQHPNVAIKLINN